ncbi:MAG: hypothetical protein JHD38_11975, partial [Mycolicibacterium sp.]|nr:hypothetical protein [Mycolicibacterium sp.]
MPSDALSPEDESASPEGAPSAEPALGPADESLELVASANATGIQAVIAAPIPSATAKAPTRPIWLDGWAFTFGAACFAVVRFGVAFFGSACLGEVGFGTSPIGFIGPMSVPLLAFQRV